MSETPDERSDIGEPRRIGVEANRERLSCHLAVPGRWRVAGPIRRILFTARRALEGVSLGVYEVAALLGISAVVAFCVFKRSYFFSGTVLGASLVGYGLAFFLTSCGLKRQGVGWVRVFYAVAGVAAARWLFELCYHFAFPVSFTTVLSNLRDLSTNISETGFPLVWSVMMVMIVFTGFRYMSAGRWFWIALGASGVLFLFWVLIGYPQWVHPEQWPVRPVAIPLIPSDYRHAPTPAARDFISTTSLVINSLTKIVVCAILPSLFLGNPRRQTPDA